MYLNFILNYSRRKFFHKSRLFLQCNSCGNSLKFWSYSNMHVRRHFRIWECPNKFCPIWFFDKLYKGLKTNFQLDQILTELILIHLKEGFVIPNILFILNIFSKPLKDLQTLLVPKSFRCCTQTSRKSGKQKSILNGTLTDKTPLASWKNTGLAVTTEVRPLSSTGASRSY